MTHRPAIVLAATLLVVLALEATAFVGLRVLGSVTSLRYEPNRTSLSPSQQASLEQLLARDDATDQRSLIHDGALGWVPVREANAAGMRDSRDYDPVPAPGTVRIAAFGDSFTYGSDVPLQDSWIQQLMRLQPSREIFNYGVPAYGTDQAYLRYQDRKDQRSAHIVLIGYMSENLARNVNVFRPFYSRSYDDFILSKPRFLLDDRTLELLPNPMPTIEHYAALRGEDAAGTLQQLGLHDYHYRSNAVESWLDASAIVRLAKLTATTVNRRFTDPIFSLDGGYVPTSEAYRVTRSLIDRFYRDVLADGSLPIVLIFPDLHDQRDSRAGKPRRYAPLLDHLRDQGYRHMDLMSALEPYEDTVSIDDLVEDWGHFSATGGAILAAHIDASLQQAGLTDALAIARAVDEERARR